MIALVYKQGSNEITHIVEHIMSYTETDVIGKDASIKGINLTQASFCIVESTALQVGDTLGEFTDTRHLLPKTPEQKTIDKLKSDNEQMNLQIIDLFEQLVEKGLL